MKNKDKYFNRVTDNNSFARIIFTMVNEYHNAPDGFTKTQIKWSLQTTISCWSDKPYKMISKKIADHFIINHPTVNPFKLKWKTCKKYGVVGDRNQRYIVFEHTTPISMVINQVFSSKTFDEILNVLELYSGICLITRDEDNVLYDKGYGSNRTIGWVKAYNDCGIEVITESQYNEYKNSLSVVK